MQLRDKTAQNVFRINLGVEAYALCDSVSARTVFQYDKVMPSFVMIKSSCNLSDIA